MISRTSSYAIGGDMRVHRLGFGAMHLTGDGVWGEPKDRPPPSLWPAGR